MKMIDIEWNDIAEGDEITVWYQPRGYAGQGGVVQFVSTESVTLRSPIARHTIQRTEVHHLTKEVPFDPDECLEYDPDECKGAVEMFAPGSGNAFPRCEYHRDRRQASYENSLEPYADSVVVPDWFDPSYAGEHWSEDDY